jgi:hypothetical protein
MLNKLGNRNVYRYLVALSAVAAATTALIFSLVARDLQVRSQRALGTTYTWTWITNGEAGGQTGATPQQAWSGGRLARVESPSPLVLMGAAAILIGGIVFSLLKTQRPVASASARRLARQYEAFEADLGRIENEKLLEQSKSPDEPYPHHETYPESPGEDQGQLTSHLPGSTPFLKG